MESDEIKLGLGEQVDLTFVQSSGLQENLQMVSRTTGHFIRLIINAQDYEKVKSNYEATYFGNNL